MKYTVPLAVLIILTAICGFVAGQEGKTTGLKGLRVPLEYYPDGGLKAVLTAATSSVDSAGQNITGQQLRYETYTEAGSTDVGITAEDCSYNKKTGHAESEKRVKLVKEDVVITGKGFQLDAKKAMISLNSKVVVKFDRTLKRKEKKE